MLLWVLIAFLTAAAILAVLLPLARRPHGDESAVHAARVYRDQLNELERDKAEGRISESEAEAARAEIARRLIAADAEAEKTAPRGGSRMARRAIALVALIGIPALSLSLYLTLGSPTLPGLPLAARLETPDTPQDIDTLIAKVEEHLAAAPEDGRGWDVVAPVYMRLGRAADAAQAYRNAIRILGSDAARQNGLGEALFAAEGGIVTADARAAFEAARDLDPKAPGPRHYLALAAEQEGKTEEAAREWRALLAETPADAPWRPMVEAALSRVDPSAVAPGPTADEVAAAQDMPTADQEAMIDGMVTRLAARLKEEPDDVEGWLRLIRSYAVLGRTEAAEEAGRAALAGLSEPAARGRVEALLASLGVAPAGAATQ